MIYKNISVKYILAKIYRDLGLDDSNYFYDLIEWCGEALDFIGAGAQFETKEEFVQVSDHRGVLPYGFIVLNQLKYKDGDDWKLICYNPSNFKAIENDSENKYVVTEESFSLNPNYIVTSFEEGEVLISYKSIATDDEGYPLVPDNQYYKEALFWYCFMKLILRGYMPKTDIDYGFAESRWKFYCSGARNKANYPDLSKYQRFREVWVGLLPSTIDETAFDSMIKKGIGIETVTADNLVTNPSGVQDVILDGGSP